MVKNMRENILKKKIKKFFLFGRYCGVPFREYLSYKEIQNKGEKNNGMSKRLC